MATLKEYTREQVAAHNTSDSCWIIIDAAVYDVSKFADFHPGGAVVFDDPEVAGQDCTELFYGLHRQEVLTKPMATRNQVGIIKDEQSQVVAWNENPSQVPYGEPGWLTGEYYSPYFTESHRKLQRAVRKYVTENLVDIAQDLDPKGKRPPIELMQEMGTLGINVMRLGPGKHLQGRKLFADIKPEEFDYFHELAINQEMFRLGTRGFADGLGSGFVIGLPPIINFGSDWLKNEVVEPVLRAEKFICLAVTEAFAGSDVMGIRTTATKQSDGSYIVKGTKKWITNGMFADYFTTFVKLIEDGEESGYSVLCIPRSCGVETTPVKTLYSSSAGTAYVVFDSIRVPGQYVVGQDGIGVPVVLSNFIHERWVMVCVTVRSARALCEQMLLWTSQRKAFGKPLTSQAVVRQKIAACLSEVEAAQNWLENITYQMNQMDYDQQSRLLAGPVALLKSWSTRVSLHVAETAVNLFGGRGITTTGMGRFVAEGFKTIKHDAVLGGSEEILADLGVRQALRSMPSNHKL